MGEGGGLGFRVWGRGGILGFRAWGFRVCFEASPSWFRGRGGGAGVGFRVVV